MTETRTHRLSTRISLVLVVLSALVLILATLATTAASFASYEQDAESRLLSEVSAVAEVLADDATVEDMAEELSRVPLVEVRATLVAADGTVVYDNLVDAATLGNHGDRQEVVTARTTGQGAILRNSDTLGTDALYAAVLVRDGIVIRLAETRTSLASFLGGMGPQLAGSLLVIVLLSLLTARLLTRMVVRPLTRVNLAHPLESETYEEVHPLLERVDSQRRELMAQNRALERASRIRRDFTGNVSHEMKSPLQVIGGYAELMENGLVPAEEIPRFAGLIRGEAVQMRDLVDDILTLSRLDEGAAANLGRVDVALACQRAAGRLAPKAESQQATVELHQSGDCHVTGDIRLLEQLAYNLIDNAISYGPEGGKVTVEVFRTEAGNTSGVAEGGTARVVVGEVHQQEGAQGKIGSSTSSGMSVGAPRDSADGYVVLRVADQGPGVPEELKPRIFERFYRIDASRSRETGGTGLGLAIVKHIVEDRGGTIRVDDVTPTGAAFVVTLPAA